MGSYVLVNIVRMDLQRIRLYKNITVYDLCIDTRHPDRICFQKRKDLDIDSQCKLDDFYSQCLKRTLADIQP